MTTPALTQPTTQGDVERVANYLGAQKHHRRCGFDQGCFCQKEDTHTASLRIAKRITELEAENEEASASS